MTTIKRVLNGNIYRTSIGDRVAVVRIEEGIWHTVRAYNRGEMYAGWYAPTYEEAVAIADAEVVK